MFLENQTKACKSRVIKRSKGLHFHDVNGHKYWPVLIIVNIQLYSVFTVRIKFQPSQGTHQGLSLFKGCLNKNILHLARIIFAVT